MRMKIIEAERFYEQDSKKYDISKNKELLKWLKDAIKKGYSPFIDIENLQELIDNIVYWYKMKYPERELKLYEGIEYYYFKDIETLSKVMNIKQLMYRLPHDQLRLMGCEYRSNYESTKSTYNKKGVVTKEKTILFIKIDEKKNECDHSSIYRNLSNSFSLQIEADSGKVDIDDNLRKYVNDDKINLDKLLILFTEKYSNELDFTDLQRCIYNHNCDMELRKRVLQLAALKLLYSNRTIPERGYERAKKLINEFNKEMDLNLSTIEIDEAINRDYSNSKKTKSIGKIIFKK